MMAKGCDTCAWTEDRYRGAYRSEQHGCGWCQMTFGPCDNERGYEHTFPLWEPRKQEVTGNGYL